jgi:hypothetical protein
MDESIVKHLEQPTDAVSQRLIKAAELIKQYGFWQSGRDCKGYPRACVLLAIKRAGDEKDVDHAYRVSLARSA